MAVHTKIEWAEGSWNPCTGCTQCSLGCLFCYAMILARRLKAMGQAKYANGFELTLHEEVLDEPLRWKKPRRIFVCSMSDLCHHRVPEAFIHRAFDVMNRANWHQFLVLTKRSRRLLEISPRLLWSPHIWAGVSIETRDYLFRADHLRKTGAAIKFLSLEPLLGPIPDLDLRGIDWVIVGGESGPRARPMEPAWAIDIRDQCLAAGVPFFFKQWGGPNKKKTGRLLEGRTWDGMPEGDSPE